MPALLQDSRVRRLLLANTLGSIGSGVTIFAVPWLLVREPDGNVAFRWATVGTTLADFADRSLGIGYAGGSSILFALLMASLAFNYDVPYWITLPLAVAAGVALAATSRMTSC